jgi:hypothetical protein
MKKIIVLLLFCQSVCMADLYRVHYSIHGNGKDIRVEASSSDDARYTVQDMFPDAVVTGVSKIGK